MDGVLCDVRARRDSAERTPRHAQARPPQFQLPIKRYGPAVECCAKPEVTTDAHDQVAHLAFYADAHRHDYRVVGIMRNTMIHGADPKPTTSEPLVGERCYEANESVALLRREGTAGANDDGRAWTHAGDALHNVGGSATSCWIRRPEDQLAVFEVTRYNLGTAATLNPRRFPRKRVKVRRHGGVKHSPYAVPPRLARRGQFKA